LIYLNLELNSIRKNFIEKIQQKTKANKANQREKGILSFEETKKSLLTKQHENSESILQSIAVRVEECRARKEEEGEDLKIIIAQDNEEKKHMAEITKEHFD